MFDPLRWTPRFLLRYVWVKRLDRTRRTEYTVSADCAALTFGTGRRLLANTQKRRNRDLMSTGIGRGIAPDDRLKAKLAALVAYGDP